MRLETRYLDTFMVVYEMGGFTRAAEQLHLTQPAVSHRIRQLERRLNIELFERGGRRLVPTDAARRLHAMAARFVGEFAALQADLGRPSGGKPSTLRMSSASGFGRYVLFPALRELADSNGYRLDLTFPTADEVLEQVEEGACDAGFVYHPRVSNRLRFRTVYVEELVLIAPIDGTHEPPAIRGADDLAGRAFVTYVESDYVFGKWFEEVFGEPARTTTSVHHFEELEEVVDMVAAGAGLSIVPDHCALRAVDAGRVRFVRPGRRRCHNRIFVVTRAGAALRPHVQAVLNALERRWSTT